jgi:hypothetical protein
MKFGNAKGWGVWGIVTGGALLSGGLATAAMVGLPLFGAMALLTAWGPMVRRDQS